MIDTYDLTNPEKPTISKDPDAVLDYGQTWVKWLALVQDDIAACSVFAESPLVVIGPATFQAGVVTAIISGRTPGAIHRVTFSITTARLDLTDQRSIYLRVRQR